jgi:hypothetical protein
VNLNIGAKRPIDGDQVFLVGDCHSSSESPFVLLHDAVKARRFKRNIQKIDPSEIVNALGSDAFIKVEAPRWGTVWFRASRIRDVRELPADCLPYSEVKFGAFVLFEHDPEPPDEHAGFLLFGIEVKRASILLNQFAGHSYSANSSNSQPPGTA